MTGRPAPSSRLVRPPPGRFRTYGTSPRRDRVGNRRRQPPVKILRRVSESEGHDPTVVALELPQDVAGTKPACDEEDQLLRQWPVGADHAGVGQQIRQSDASGSDPPLQGPTGIDHRPGMI